MKSVSPGISFRLAMPLVVKNCFDVCGNRLGMMHTAINVDMVVYVTT